MGCLSLAMALTAALMVGGSPKDGGVKAEGAGLVGTWQCLSGDADGHRALDTSIARMKLHFRADGTYCCETGDSSRSEGTYTVHPGPEAWMLNLKCRTGPLPGKTLFCIYERKGDELRLCYALFGTDRPTEFTSGAGTRHILMVYRRESTQQAADPLTP